MRGTWLALLVAFAACTSERTPVTKRVAVLGYAKLPAIAIVTRGESEFVAPWVDSLRQSLTAEVMAEFGEPMPTIPGELCKAVRDAMPEGAHLDEIVTIETTLTNEDKTTCIREDCKIDPDEPDGSRTCDCVEWRYAGSAVEVATTITSLRASTCDTIRSQSLPVSSGQAITRDPIDYPAGDEDVMAIAARDAKVEDVDASRGRALDEVKTAAQARTWQTYPDGAPIVSVKNHTVVIGAKLPEGDYLIKLVPHSKLEPGVRAVDRTTNTTTFQLAPQLPTPHAGDELHVTTDTLRVSGYTSFGGGTLHAHNEAYLHVSASAAARFAYDRRPVMSEIAISGDIIPTLAQRMAISFAYGLRLPVEPISPVAFAEIGLGAAHQGNDGARAVTAHAGLGAGFEVWLRHWFVFGDIRQRWTAVSDWEDSMGNPLTVEHPDGYWRSTTVQLGVGRRL